MKNRLRELREEKGLTLNELSNELLKRLDFKIGSNALGKYERGEREPRLNTWAKLADFFGVSIGYIQGTSKIRKSFYNEKDPFKALFDDTAEKGNFNEIIGDASIAIVKDTSIKHFYEVCHVLNFPYHISQADVEKNKELIKSINSVGAMDNFTFILDELFQLSLYAYNDDKKAKNALTAIKKVLHDYLELGNDDETSAIADHFINELEKD